MRHTKIPWVYNVELQHSDSVTTTGCHLTGHSVDEVLAQLDETRYRNWSVTKIERVTYISDISDWLGPVETFTRER